MLNCPNCKHEMAKTTGRHQYRECGLDNVWLKEWPMYVCRDCGITMPILPDPDVIGVRIVQQLVREENRLDGHSILFLRMALRLKAVELAHILGVSRVEVSRWENHKNTISPIHDFRLRMEAIDRLLPLVERRDTQTEIALIFHRSYNEDSDVSEEEINIPAALAIA